MYVQQRDASRATQRERELPSDERRDKETRLVGLVSRRLPYALCLCDIYCEKRVEYSVEKLYVMLLPFGEFSRTNPIAE